MIAAPQRFTPPRMGEASTSEPALEDPQGFQDWLATYKDEDPVGETCNGVMCPISNFLTHVYGRLAYVRHTMWEIKAEGHQRVLPTWAQHLVYRVDDLGYKKGGAYDHLEDTTPIEVQHSITAGEVRQLLEEVLACQS